MRPSNRLFPSPLLGLFKGLEELDHPFLYGVQQLRAGFIVEIYIQWSECSAV